MPELYWHIDTVDFQLPGWWEPIFSFWKGWLFERTKIPSFLGPKIPQQPSTGDPRMHSWDVPWIKWPEQPWLSNAAAQPFWGRNGPFRADADPGDSQQSKEMGPWLRSCDWLEVLEVQLGHGAEGPHSSWGNNQSSSKPHVDHPAIRYLEFQSLDMGWYGAFRVQKQGRKNKPRCYPQQQRWETHPGTPELNPHRDPIRLRKTSEPGLRGLAPDEDGLVPLEEVWKLLQRLGSFKAGDCAIAKGCCSPTKRSQICRWAINGYNL